MAVMQDSRSVWTFKSRNRTNRW